MHLDDNNATQCGHPACPQISTFKLVNGPKLGGVKEKVVQAAAGITFSVVLTESGKGEHSSVANWGLVLTRAS